jgi:hypothetical protein
MIFDPVQPANSEEGEAVMRGRLHQSRRSHIHSKPTQNQLSVVYKGKVLANVIEVVLGYRKACAAVCQLQIEIRVAEQKVGAVQGHTVGDVEEPSRHHSDPCRKISVVHVNVPDTVIFE